MSDLLLQLQDFHFLRPWWLLALLIVALSVWLLQQREQRSGDWAQIISPQLQPFLIEGQSSKAVALRPAIIAAGIIATLALAGPTWQQTPLPIHKQQSGLVILFDLSPSMRATDITPNRLTRARLKTIDLLNNHQQGFVGLIVYAGDAHVVSPLTDDAATIITQMPALAPEIMPEAGSNPEQAVEKALELMMNAGFLEGHLLLVTDGVTIEAGNAIHRILDGFPEFSLSILGVGTEEGAPIPLDNRGFARDNNGGIVIARLFSGELQGIAQRHGGRYSTLSGDERDIDYLLAPIQAQTLQQSKELERKIDTWDDKGQWLVFLLLPLAILAFRKGIFALILITPLLYSPQGNASLWQDLWQTRDQQGHRALQNQQPDQAAQLFKNPLWKGTAAYQQGDYESAADAFANIDTATAKYNYGNSLANTGRLEEALEAYNQALALTPDMADASHNKKIVEQRLNQQKQEQSQNQDQDQNQEQNQEQNQKQSDNGSNGSEKDEQQDSKPGSDPGSSSKSDSDSKPEDDNNSPQSPPEQSQEQPSPNSEDDQKESDPNSNLQQEQQKQEEQESSSQPENSEKNDADTDKNQPQPPSEKQDGEKNQPQAMPSQLSDEESEALEQWLRRVPDDPGGLLKRKFKYLNQQRYNNQQRRQQTPPDRFSEERW